MIKAVIMRIMETSIKDFLTIGCTVLGASLGIINTVTGLNQRRVKLKVVPKIAVSDGGGR